MRSYILQWIYYLFIVCFFQCEFQRQQLLLVCDLCVTCSCLSRTTAG